MDLLDLADQVTGPTLFTTGREDPQSHPTLEALAARLDALAAGRRLTFMPARVFFPGYDMRLGVPVLAVRAHGRVGSGDPAPLEDRGSTSAAQERTTPPSSPSGGGGPRSGGGGFTPDAGQTPIHNHGDPIGYAADRWRDDADRAAGLRVLQAMLAQPQRVAA